MQSCGHGSRKNRARPPSRTQRKREVGRRNPSRTASTGAVRARTPELIPPPLFEFITGANCRLKGIEITDPSAPGTRAERPRAALRRARSQLGDRVVVVTGAAAGVGRATARALGRAGARVGLIARDRESLEAAKREIEAMGAIALVCPLDVATAEDVEAAAVRIERELGPIDAWINNAMVTVVSPIAELRPDEIRRVTEVTYLGAVHGTMAALARMLPRDRGTIVQVGSALAYRAIPLQAAYCGAKFALRGFTDSLRSELEHDGSRVRVTMVQMPALDTPQFDWCRTRMPHQPQPVPPIFEPELAADAILWALLHPRRELLVGAPTWKAVWANKLLPGFIDRYLARTGYASQQTDEPVSPDRRDNLFEPVRGDHGARGRFAARARRRSAAFWCDTHRRTLAACLVLAAATSWTVARRGRRAWPPVR